MSCTSAVGVYIIRYDRREPTSRRHRKEKISQNCREYRVDRELSVENGKMKKKN